MNERIKELANKAEFVNKRHNGDEWRWGYIDPELSSKLEKFAELIVRECAKFLEDNSGYDTSNNAWHPEPEDLLQHFGVGNERTN